jgi:hypothetical protein
MPMELAHVFGAVLRKKMPDATWERIPDAMLRLLVEIEKAEADRETFHHRPSR